MTAEEGVSLITSGKADDIGAAAAIMTYLAQHLWMDGKKFRVTIDCDPETNRFEIVRHEVNESL